MKASVLLFLSVTVKLENRIYVASKHSYFSQGYRGVLCGACEKTHGKLRSGRCIRCGRRAKNIVFATLAGVWSLVIALILVKNSLHTAKKLVKQIGMRQNETQAHKVDAGTGSGGTDSEAMKLPGGILMPTVESKHARISIDPQDPKSRIRTQNESNTMAKERNYTSDIYKVGRNKHKEINRCSYKWAGKQYANAFMST